MTPFFVIMTPILTAWLVLIVATIFLAVAADVIHEDRLHEVVFAYSLAVPVMFPLAVLCVLRACLRRSVGIALWWVAGPLARRSQYRTAHRTRMRM